MKIAKKILNWLLFLSILVAFHFYAGQFVLNISPDKIYRAKNLRYFLQEEQPFDVVLIGNSHMFYGTLPLVMNELLPETRVISLAHYPSSPIESYPYVRQLVTSEHPPRVIVLDVYSLTQPESRLDWAVAPWQNFPILPNLARHVPPAEQLNWVFPFLTSHTMWKDAGLVQSFWQTLFKPADDPTQLAATLHLSARPYVNNSVMGIEKYTKSFQAGTNPLNQREQWELQAYVDLCEQHGVELMLVNLPAANQWDRPHPEIEEAVQDFDLPFRDYNQVIAREHHFGRILFLDTDQPDETFNSHMNAMGALLTSLYLAQDLAELYDFPFDETQRASFQEVLLQEVVVHGVDAFNRVADGEETITFEAMPLIEDSDLEYRWLLKKGDEVIETKGYSTTKRTFTMPAMYWDNQYRLFLLLRHPTFDGMLENSALPFVFQLGR